MNRFIELVSDSAPETSFDQTRQAIQLIISARYLISCVQPRSSLLLLFGNMTIFPADLSGISTWISRTPANYRSDGPKTGDLLDPDIFILEVIQTVAHVHIKGLPGVICRNKTHCFPVINSIGSQSFWGHFDCSNQVVDVWVYELGSKVLLNQS